MELKIYEEDFRDGITMNDFQTHWEVGFQDFSNETQKAIKDVGRATFYTNGEWTSYNAIYPPKEGE
jgi:hypothetical protein